MSQRFARLVLHEKKEFEYRNFVLRVKEVMATNDAHVAGQVYRRFILPPINFPGAPEWRRIDQALKAELDAPQPPPEQRDQAARDIFALFRRDFFSAGDLFSSASHRPVDTAQYKAMLNTRTSRSSLSVRSIRLSSRLKPRVL